MLFRTTSAPILHSWTSSPDVGFYSHSRNISHSSSTSFLIDAHHSIKPQRKSAAPKHGRMQVVEMVMGGGDTGGGRGSDGYYDSDHEHGYGHDDMDKYYQDMIKANPGNALLLGNYANFLIEVRGDYDKAEEYCERGILEDNETQCDANILCIYAELIWRIKRDAHRAQYYFNLAVISNPTDCYVMASYARFLWDVNEDEQDDQHKNDLPAGKLFIGCNSDHSVPASALS